MTQHGTCRICLDEKKLTKEHVPPSSAYNKDTKYVSASFEEYAKQENKLNQRIKGKIHQGGVGYYSLCSECNSFLGRNYVKEYQTWANCGVKILSFFKEEIRTRCNLININPNKILKQIISMFLSINDDQFALHHPSLIAYVKNPESCILDEKYRIFMYSNMEGQMRYSSLMVNYLPETGVVTLFEIAFPPFGYVLTFDFKGTLKYLTEITGFKNHKSDQVHSINLQLSKLPTYLPYPLDYRTRDKIERDIQNNKEQIKKLSDEYSDN